MLTFSKTTKFLTIKAKYYVVEPHYMEDSTLDKLAEIYVDET